MDRSEAAAVDLYWLPLGAGGHSVRLNGLAFEAVAARLKHRTAADLYHSALEVHVPQGRFVIENDTDRGRQRCAARRGGRGSGWQPLGVALPDLSL
jgi:hypothetical protein